MATRQDVTISESLQRKIKYRRKEIIARKLNRILPSAITVVSLLIFFYLLATRF